MTDNKPEHFLLLVADNMTADNPTERAVSTARYLANVAATWATQPAVERRRAIAAASSFARTGRA